MPQILTINDISNSSRSLSMDQDHIRLLRDARLARKEFGSEYQILTRYEKACSEMVKFIPNFDLDVAMLAEVGKTWLWSFEPEDNSRKQRKLFNFWRELTDILSSIIMQ